MLKVAYHACYAHPLPEGHRFPMAKYELIPEQLRYEGTLSESNFFAPEICPDSSVLLAHDAAYLEKLKTQSLSAAEQRRIGFPQSAALTERELRITQGTIDCCRFAREYGVSLNVAGGTHHAYADRGEGFCLLNDFAVAAHCLLQENPAMRILIIDLDVHQGNGTAKIFERLPQVFTFSLHGKHNYPFHKEQSDLDVPLADGIRDHEYLEILETRLYPLLNNWRPDFAFYLSGVDILETDRFGKLAISPEGCRLRDKMVLEELAKRGIPCTIAMGGGYSPQLKDIVEAHCQTFRVAKDAYGMA